MGLPRRARGHSVGGRWRVPGGSRDDGLEERALGVTEQNAQPWEDASGKGRRCLPEPCPVVGARGWGGSLLGWRDPWSEPLRLQNVIKGSGDAGERNEGLLVVRTR